MKTRIHIIKTDIIIEIYMNVPYETMEEVNFYSIKILDSQARYCCLLDVLILRHTQTRKAKVTGGNYQEISRIWGQ